jgi:hypothetical protein
MLPISGPERRGGPDQAEPAAMKKNGAERIAGARNSAGLSSRPPQSVSPAAAELPSAPKTLSALAQALGLPRDALSATILSFARYFSLPLNPVLLTRIRRESLAPAPAEISPGQTRSPPGRTAPSAAALASAALAAKGLELSREGLAAYAAALTPDHPENRSGGGGTDIGGDSGGDGPGAEPGNGGGEPGGGSFTDSGGESGRGDSGGDSPGSLQPRDLSRAERLREKVLEIEPPLLGFLNRVPGKKGEQWIVLPFAFAQDGLEYRVVLRILVDGPPSSGSPGRLALDIFGGNRDQPALRWFFMYDKLPGETARLSAHFWPPESKKSLTAFQKELARLFLLHPKQIYVQNDEKNALFAIDCRENVLPSINEEG